MNGDPFSIAVGLARGRSDLGNNGTLYLRATIPGIDWRRVWPREATRRAHADRFGAQGVLL